MNAILINGALGLLPVMAFLFMLTQWDSFKLVRRGHVLGLIGAGAGAALAANVIGRWIIDASGATPAEFARLGGPIVEEALKALVIYALIRTNRIGFVLDAAIAGFAVGAGFAVLENYFYLQVLGQGKTALWVVRGFGTAIMHGGASAIFAALVQKLTPQEKAGGLRGLSAGFAAAAALHVGFNQFLAFPIASTLAMMVGLAVALSAVLHRERQSMDRWLEVDFDDYRRLLAELRSGEAGEHNIGRILDSLRIRFDPTEVAEIHDYVELHTELVLFAENILKAHGRGETYDIPEEVREKLAHFHYLEERIGRAVRLVLGRSLKFSRYELFQLYKLQRDAGGVVRKEHAFNTDLLLSEADRDAASRAFPDVFFALDDPLLRETFMTFDRRANLFRARSRRWGMIAVWLTASALILASGELLYSGLAPAQLRIIGAIGLGSGAACVLIAVFGMIFMGRKKRWIADRLATERLRQLHFQYYIANAATILQAAKDDAARALYLERRAAVVEDFQRDFLDHIDERLHRIVHDDDIGDGVLFTDGRQPIDEDDPHLAQYFNAYARLRFEMQINYCNHVLRESRSLRKPSAARLAQMLGGVAMAGLIAMLILYSLVFLGLFAEIGWMRSAPVHAAAIWAAIAAVTARTFEEGLQPDRELERMRHYRTMLRRTHQRFRDAGDAAARLEAMSELEKVAFEEMAGFLKSSVNARFVM